MKNTKRALCLLMAFCLLLGSFTVGAAAADEISFSDVAKDAWYYSPIIKAVEKGIVLGNADGTYAPNGTLTWAQTITFAVRLDQLRKGEKVYGSEDAAGENWYDIYVDYALDNGIINSVPVTPNGTITRADAAIIFSKVLYRQEHIQKCIRQQTHFRQQSQNQKQLNKCDYNDWKCICDFPFEVCTESGLTDRLFQCFRKHVIQYG